MGIVHIHSSPPHHPPSLLSLRVGLVPSIYPLVCASSLSSSYISVPTSYVFCVLVLIVSSAHRFIVFLHLNPLRLPVCCCCLAHPWACILLTNNILLSRILTMVPRIPLTLGTQTNQPHSCPF